MLVVELGENTLEGGEGADAFVFESFDESKSVITDFEPGIDRIVFDSLSPEDVSLVFDGTDTFIVFARPSPWASTSTILVEGVEVTFADIFFK